MIVIITGSSKGIGKAIAEQFAKSANTILLCSRGEKQLYDTVANLQTEFPSAIIKGRPCDMSNKTEVIEFANWCLQHGTPDIIVNNAGELDRKSTRLNSSHQ